MNEIATTGQIASAVVVLTLFMASPLMAVQTIRRRRRGESLVAWNPRPRPQFGLAEIAATFLIYMALSLGAQYLLVEYFKVPMGAELSDISPDQFLLLVLMNSLGVATSCGALVLMIPFRRGASIADLGLTLRHAAQDIALGFRGFLLMAGFVYFLQIMLSLVFPDKIHPLLELIRNNPEPKYFLGAIVSASIMAPIFEEVFFRGSLQGWLEKHLLHGDEADETANAFQAADDSGHLDIALAHPAMVTSQERSPDDNPYRSPQPPANVADSPTAEQAAMGKISWLAIVVSSLLFAAAHIGQGPAPIPLFFLAVCLGYMYQRTHRLLPCITLHALLNTTSIAMLWLSVAA